MRQFVFLCSICVFLVCKFAFAASPMYIIPVSTSDFAGIDDYPDPNQADIGNTPCGSEIYPYYTGHEGMDYILPTNTPVYAAADGVVHHYQQLCSSINENCFGYYMGIDHGNGRWTLYAHLNSYVAAAGEHVQQGDIIAFSGESGPTYPHLHWEVLTDVQSHPVYGNPHNPYYCDGEWFLSNPPPYADYRSVPNEKQAALTAREQSQLSHLNPYSGHEDGDTVGMKLGGREGDLHKWFPSSGISYADDGVARNAYVQDYTGGVRDGAIIVHQDSSLAVQIYNQQWDVWAGGDTSAFTVRNNCNADWFAGGSKYGPSSEFGLPITGVYYVNSENRWRQDFQRGYMSWDPSNDVLYLNCYTYATPGWMQNSGWHSTYSVAVAQAYERNGAKEAVGYADNDNGGGYLLHPWNDVYVQNFNGGTLGNKVAIIANAHSPGENAEGAAVVRDGFWEYYAQHNGSVAFGAPLGDEMDTFMHQGTLLGYDPYCDADASGAVSSSERWNCIDTFCGSGYSSMQRFANVTLCYNPNSQHVACDPLSDNCACPTTSCTGDYGGGGGAPLVPSSKVDRRYKPFTGDFDGDGFDDVGVYEAAYGYWYIALSSGTYFAPSGSNNGRWLSDWGTERRSAWQYQPLVGDFNGDGMDDVALYEDYYGYWYVALSTGSSFAPAGSNNGRWLSGWGQQRIDEPWQYQPLIGDFNGDGRDDAALYEARYGYWYVATSTGTGFVPSGSNNGRWLSDWAATDGNLWRYIPLVGDYNGDGTDDIIAYEPNYGYWYVAVSEDTYFRLTSGHSSRWLENWSVARSQYQYEPLIGDFNGDDVHDVAAYEEQYGFWYAAMSRDTYFDPVGGYTNKRWLEDWATARREQYQYVPLVGDFNGDGRDDIIAYEPDYGYWYVATGESGAYFRPTQGHKSRWLSDWATNDE